MDYKKHYNLLMEKAQKAGRVKSKEAYFEKHHIVPESEGGTNAKSNLVLLTAREHFIAHWLLYRDNPNIQARAYSFWRMCNKQSKKHKRITASSRSYQEAREAFVKNERQKKLTSEHVEKMKIAREQSLNKGMTGKTHSTKTKKRISQALKGKKDSPERLEAKRKYMLENNPMKNPISREKVRQSKVGTPIPRNWKPVSRIASDGEIVNYESLKAVEAAGFNKYAVQNACSANKNLDTPKHSSGGFKWIYKD